MSKYEELLQHIPKLRQEALNELLKRTRAALSFIPGATPGKPAQLELPVDEHDWLLSGIRETLRARGLPTNMPQHLVRQMFEYKLFDAAAPVVGDWLLKLVPGMSRSEKLALSAIAARALASDVRQFAPVGMSTMLRFYCRVPDAFERSFPEYARNGFVPFLIRR